MKHRTENCGGNLKNEMVAIEKPFYYAYLRALLNSTKVVCCQMAVCTTTALNFVTCIKSEKEIKILDRKKYKGKKENGNGKKSPSDLKSSILIESWVSRFEPTACSNKICPCSPVDVAACVVVASDVAVEFGSVDANSLPSLCCNASLPKSTMFC
uniref:Bifunctional inhibitor/plant lipid transfer protein/seed storage helical domain-containing protein n=1 Tax=Romanomermis culicivorax TaxID=13658 RepID=A0A915I3I7_ROMCU